VPSSATVTGRAIDKYGGSGSGLDVDVPADSACVPTSMAAAVGGQGQRDFDRGSHVHHFPLLTENALAHERSVDKKKLSPQTEENPQRNIAR
jgi:hypothetical protein